MQPTVTAILVARNGADSLPRTLEALARQSRRPDSLVAVDAGSTDGTEAILAAAGPTQLVSTQGKRTFGDAVAFAMHVVAPAESGNDWLWLLAHDNAPEPGALAALLGAVEVAPSVAIAGPKLMYADQRDVIAEYGETVTRLGASIAIVENELDQAQHDNESDLLAVAAGGMLVRRSVWTALGGFDPSLPSIDAALDFAIRARLAGHRVVGVPAARVASAGGPELFGRKSVSVRLQNRIKRSAQLHRRLVYAPGFALPLHWLSLLPLAIIRSIGHLLAKRPGAVGSEFSSAFRAAFTGGVAPARRNLRTNQVMGWSAIAPLRMSWQQVREQRATQRALVSATAGESEPRVRPSFLSGGGAWMVLLTAGIGILTFGGFLGAGALSGGGLLPLSAAVSDIWRNLGYGWNDIGAGFVGAADPFTSVLALLGTLTFWAPSFSIVLLYLTALPLAALAAWWCAARLSERAWAPAIAALLWALAPPFLVSLSTGHLGAVIAHLLLPWLVLALINAGRSWSAAGAAGLLFAAVSASAPSLTPALVIAWFVSMVFRPKSVHRLIGIPLLAVALWVPLVLQQLRRGNLLALFADPGVPVLGTTPSGWQLALGSPSPDLGGWVQFVAGLGLPGLSAPIAVAVLLAPLAALALMALFLPGSRRAIPAMILALLGFVTAVAGGQLEVAAVGAQTTPLWPGAGLSLFWLGLIGSAVLALESLGRRASLPALLASVTATLVAVPLLLVPITGASAVQASTGRMLPALTTAEAASRPTVGTLRITAQPDGSIAATIERGLGTTLDDQSTLDSTATTMSKADSRLATLAGNLSSRSGFDAASELTDWHIAFVLVPATTDAGAAEVRQRVAEALDGNRIFTPIGMTSNGFLWYFPDALDGELPAAQGPLDSVWGIGVLSVQALVFLFFLLLAIPTTRRRKSTARGGSSEPATTFEEDDSV